MLLSLLYVQAKPMQFTIQHSPLIVYLIFLPVHAGDVKVFRHLQCFMFIFRISDDALREKQKEESFA